MIGGASLQVMRPALPSAAASSGGFFGNMFKDVEDTAKNIFDNTEVAQGIKDMFGHGGPAPAPVTPGAVVEGAGKAVASGGFMHGMGEVFGGLWHGISSGALVSGIVSTVVNGFEVITGKEQVSQAAGGVAADTTDGAVSGLTGAAASGIALAAAGALGVAGLPLTILGVVGGLAGAFLGTAFFQSTGLYTAVKNGVTGLFGGTTASTTSQAVPASVA